MRHDADDHSNKLRQAHLFAAMHEDSLTGVGFKSTPNVDVPGPDTAKTIAATTTVGS